MKILVDILMSMYRNIVLFDREILFLCRYDFLFDDEDDESRHSDLTDEEELRFVDENNVSDNDDEDSPTPVWH